MFILGKYITPHSIFSKHYPFEVPGHCWNWKFLSAYSSSFLRTRRIHGKYLSTYGECAESIWAYLENTLKVFKRTWRIWQIGVNCGTQNRFHTPKVFKRIRRIRGKNLCVHGKDAKRLLAYSPNTPKDIKVCISQLIIIRMLKFFWMFLSTLYGMD